MFVQTSVSLPGHCRHPVPLCGGLLGTVCDGVVSGTSDSHPFNAESTLSCDSHKRPPTPAQCALEAESAGEIAWSRQIALTACKRSLGQAWS